MNLSALAELLAAHKSGDLRTSEAAWAYDAKAAGLDPDLRYRLGPVWPMLDRLDPRLRQPVYLSEPEINDLVKFVGDSLLDSRSRKDSLCKLIPRTLPSQLSPLVFQGCQ